MKNYNGSPSKRIPFFKGLLTFIILIAVSALAAALISYPLGFWAIKNGPSFTIVMMILLLIALLFFLVRMILERLKKRSA